MKLLYLVLIVMALGGVSSVPARAAEDKEDLRKALNDLDAGASWIYDDLESAFAAARKTAKPLLVVFRCVP
jgi:hypothetical protein